MKRQTFTILASLVLVVLLLASCTNTPATTQPTTVTGSVSATTTSAATTTAVSTTATATTPAASNEPVYGGSLSFVVSQTGGFDPANVLNFFPSWCLIYDSLVVEDWTKGPSGSGEIPLSSNYTPQRYFTSWLAESWEIPDALNIIYHLRQDVSFWNKAPVNGRIMTADDIVFNFNHDKAAATSSLYNSKVTVTKIDKFTVKFTHVDAVLEIVKTGYSNFVIGAPEIAQQFGDMTDWKKVVGTGPFMPYDVVPESSITFVKNPNYFAKDPLHPENKIPYIDTLRALVIIDTATQDAALRTGKIASLGTNLERAKSLLKTNPELISHKVYPTNTYVLCLRTDVANSPLANVKVRQALSMAIDRTEIVEGMFLGDATIQQWPFQPTAGGAYTPLDQLPANLKKLYEYHPQDAKTLIAEAGYPNGFDITIEMLQGTYAGGTDMYSVVKKYWDDIGVRTTLQIDDATAFWSRLVGHTYKDTSPCAWGNTSPSGGLYAHYGGYLYNYSVVKDAKIDAALTATNQILNDVERDAAYKEIGLYIIEQQYYINMPTPYGYSLWYPWLKGYNGEVAWGTLNGWYGMYRFTWIDQTLKDEMTR